MLRLYTPYTDLKCALNAIRLLLHNYSNAEHPKY